MVRLRLDAGTRVEAPSFGSTDASADIIRRVEGAMPPLRRMRKAETAACGVKRNHLPLHAAQRLLGKQTHTSGELRDSRVISFSHDLYTSLCNITHG